MKAMKNKQARDLIVALRKSELDKRLSESQAKTQEGAWEMVQYLKHWLCKDEYECSQSQNPHNVK